MSGTAVTPSSHTEAMSFEELLGDDWLPSTDRDAGDEPETDSGPSKSTGNTSGVRQLSLIKSPDRDWELEESTKRRGRRGVAEARAVLEGVKPPEVYGVIPAA